MKIAASEAQWSTCDHCGFSAVQIGGFTESDKTPSFSIEIPDLLSYLATGSLNGTVTGLNNLNQQYSKQHGPGNYKPPVRPIYWSMRAMAGVGSLIALIAIVSAYLLWRRKLERLRWFLWIGVANSFFPFVATSAGWVLTEVGRQPWIVQGLLKTSDANSPNVTTTWLGISLCVFIALYLALLVADVWLMRRYAGIDPTETQERAPEAVPAPGF
jgi:cytochrome d ubiquinol oxidase subunit I